VADVWEGNQEVWSLYGEGRCLFGNMTYSSTSGKLCKLLRPQQNLIYGSGVRRMEAMSDNEGENISELEEEVFRLVSRSPAPSKVIAFSWKLLMDRIPSKQNLDLQNCLGNDANVNCVFCEAVVETSSHLFLHCLVINQVWTSVMNWLEFNFVTHPNLFVHFACWSDMANSKKIRRGFWLIWHAVVWVIWRKRNDRIFNNKVKGVEEMVEDVKGMSWFWVLSKLKVASSLLYDWS